MTQVFLIPLILGTVFVIIAGVLGAFGPALQSLPRGDWFGIAGGAPIWERIDTNPFDDMHITLTPLTKRGVAKAQTHETVETETHTQTTPWVWSPQSSNGAAAVALGSAHTPTTAAHPAFAGSAAHTRIVRAEVGLVMNNSFVQGIPDDGDDAMVRVEVYNAGSGQSGAWFVTFTLPDGSIVRSSTQSPLASGERAFVTLRFNRTDGDILVTLVDNGQVSDTTRVDD